MHRPQVCWLFLFLIASPLFGGEVKATKPAATPLYKTRYRVIDVHAHASFHSDAAVRAQLEMLDRVGVKAFNLVLFASSDWPGIRSGGWSEANLLTWLEVRKQNPERVLVFGTVDFSRAAKEPAFFGDIVRELEQGVSRGMQGVKIWKNLGMHYRDKDGKLLRADDARLDPFWKMCAKLGVPILIHTADPREYWYPNTYNTYQYKGPSTAKYYQHAEVPTWEDLMKQCANVLKKHPRTQFIAAHFGSMSDDFDALAKALDTHPNLSVDSAARLRFMYRYHPQAVRDFFVKYQDRILFGTDGFLAGDPKILENAESLRQWQERQAAFYSRFLEYFETDHVGILEPGGTYREWMRLTGVNLPAEVLEKFYHGNLERLVPGLKR